MKEEIQKLIEEMELQKSKDTEERAESVKNECWQNAQYRQGKIESFDFAIERLSEILKDK